jgi:hypothetical protein
VFGPLVQKLWRSIDFSFKLENAYSPENYPIFGELFSRWRSPPSGISAYPVTDGILEHC